MLGVFTIPFTGFEIPPDTVLGIVTGLTYSLLGIGLTLVYRSNRVLNFAHGEMGALVAFVVPFLVINHHVNYWFALLLSLGGAAALGGVIEVTVIRRLASAPRLLVLVATIGVSQLLFMASVFIPRGRLGQATYPVPFSWSLHVGGVTLPPGHLMILAVVPVLALGLHTFLRRSKIGLASRAAAENEEAAMLAGIPVHRISLAIWIVAGLFAGASAVLIGPTKPVLTDAALGPSLMVRGLAAGVVGGLVSIPLAFVGGIAVGLLEFLVLWNYPTGGALEITLFIAIIAMFLFHRRLGSARRGGEGTSWSHAVSTAALDPELLRHARIRRLRWISAVVALVAAIAVPILLTNAHRVLLSSVVLFAIMGCSLVLLTGYAGQLSLGQFAFVGLGAVVGGRLNQLGYPPGTALLFATLAGGLAAVVVGLPALRIRGLFLAVTTLSFALASTTWLLNQHWLVSNAGGSTSLEIPRPVIAGIDFSSELSYYWVCLGALLAVGAAVAHVRRTGLGRSMMAVRDNEPAAATLSVSPRRTKLLAFMLSGMIASFAGYLYGGLLVNFSSQPQRVFAPEQSLLLVAMTIFGGVTSVAGAVVGAIWLRGLDYVIAPLMSAAAGERFSVLLGGTGLLFAVLQYPNGVAAELVRQRDRLFARLTGVPVHRLETTAREQGAARTPLPARVAANGATPDDPPPIEARDIVVRFGGIHAVDHVNLHAGHGEIVGLVGPNGAGKTTLFDVLTGLLEPTAGTVLIQGADATRLRPEERARLGVGRTFQQARLFDDLPLLETFQVALEAAHPSEVVPSVLGLPPSRAAERAKRLRARELVELMGLDAFAHRPTSQLSTGTRRLAELGCMVAMGAPILLLDEPTAGIAQREVEAFRPVIREIRDHLGATVVIIDHDIPMLVDLVDRMYVLASGAVIAEGDPARIREDPAVVAAYLGTSEQAINRSQAGR
jgi:ABC-type branched-subunit amino acid transport system ATPase component/ABC-type branched-subunit amino acid transport system permease subunit